MLGMIVFGSLISAVAVLSVMAKMSPRFLKIALGYEAWIDLAMSVLITVYVGMSGTISGMVIGACTGLLFGMCMFVAARTIGYTKIEMVDGKRTEVQYPPKWTVANAKALFNKFWNKLDSRYSREGEFGFKEMAQ